MKLIASLTSPFARKVRILLLLKQLPHELVVDIPWNEDTDVPRHNPLGKVPVLLTDEGEAIYDSRVIAAWLELQPGARLLPADDALRIEVLRVEALADGVADAAAAIFIERKRPEAMISLEWIDRQLLKVRRGLDALARRLGDAEHFAGGQLTLADIAVVCALGYLDFRFPEVSWREEYPRLAAWADAMGVRPGIVETRPAG